MRRFEFVDGKSEKFWEIAVEASSFTVRYGRIGATGQTQTKSFATDAKAAAEAAKLVKEKTGKGYVEVAASGSLPAAAAPTTATATATTTAAPKPSTTTAAAPTTTATTATAAAPNASTTAAPAGSGREAPASALPRVLASPPWLSKAKAKAKTVLKLETLARPHTFAWKPGELERYRNNYRPSDAESAAIVADMKHKVAEHGERVSPYIDSWWCTMRMVDAHVKEAWDTLPMVVWRANTALYVLARLGDDALPKYIDYALSLRQPTTSSVLLPLASPRVAAIMGDGFAGRRSRADAEEWLRAHPEVAAVGLVPEAVGDGKSRENAGGALRFLAARGHGEVVRAVAREYGAAAEAAVAEVLAVDPADSFPAKLPKLHSFFVPEALPRPRLKSGDDLPLTAVTALATMLAFSSPEAPYAGIAQVKEACDPASLDAFAWAIYEAWSKAGSPSKEQWALFALGYLGGDASARKLTPLIRHWPGAGLHARAVLGLDVLALIGSDIALLNLQGVAEKVKFRRFRSVRRRRSPRSPSTAGSRPTSWPTASRRISISIPTARRSSISARAPSAWGSARRSSRG
jgi:predicted DNA-binding WGR domain protein